MKTTAIIPIKLNNERLPNKNTKTLGNKPLIAHCIETLQQISAISDIYIYCSNTKIADYFPNASRAKLLLRSPNLDEPSTNFNQIFAAFSQEISADIYVYAHATAPFVTASTIKEGLSAVLSGKHDSAFCAEKLQEFLWQNSRPLNFDVANLPRTQDLSPIYKETSGVYIFTSEVYKKLGRRIGETPFILEIDRKQAVDINTPEDFAFAEHMLNF